MKMKNVLSAWLLVAALGACGEDDAGEGAPMSGAPPTDASGNPQPGPGSSQDTDSTTDPATGTPTPGDGVTGGCDPAACPGGMGGAACCTDDGECGTNLTGTCQQPGDFVAMCDMGTCLATATGMPCCLADGSCGEDPGTGCQPVDNSCGSATCDGMLGCCADEATSTCGQGIAGMCQANTGCGSATCDGLTGCCLDESTSACGVTDFQGGCNPPGETDESCPMPMFGEPCCADGMCGTLLGGMCLAGAGFPGAGGGSQPCGDATAGDAGMP